MNCFICGEPTTELDGLFTCTGCKRIWRDAGCGEWETIPQPIELKKPIGDFLEGDSYGDIVKIKDE